MAPTGTVDSIAALVNSLGTVAAKLSILKEKYGYSARYLTLVASNVWTAKAHLEAIQVWKNASDAGRPSEQLNQDLQLSLESCAVVVAVVERTLGETNLTDPDVYDKPRFVEFDAVFKDLSTSFSAVVNALQLLLTFYQCQDTSEQNEKLARSDTRTVLNRAVDRTASLQLEEKDIHDATSILSAEEPSIHFVIDDELLNSPLYQRVYKGLYLKRKGLLAQRRQSASSRNTGSAPVVRPRGDDVTGHAAELEHRARQHQRRKSKKRSTDPLNSPTPDLPFLGVPFHGEDRDKRRKAQAHKHAAGLDAKSRSTSATDAWAEDRLASDTTKELAPSDEKEVDFSGDEKIPVPPSTRDSVRTGSTRTARAPSFQRANVGVSRKHPAEQALADATSSQDDTTTSEDHSTTEESSENDNAAASSQDLSSESESRVAREQSISTQSSRSQPREPVSLGQHSEASQSSSEISHLYSDSDDPGSLQSNTRRPSTKELEEEEADTPLPLRPRRPSTTQFSPLTLSHGADEDGDDEEDTKNTITGSTSPHYRTGNLDLNGHQTAAPEVLGRSKNSYTTKNFSRNSSVRQARKDSNAKPLPPSPSSNTEGFDFNFDHDLDSKIQDALSGKGGADIHSPTEPSDGASPSPKSSKQSSSKQSSSKQSSSASSKREAAPSSGHTPRRKNLHASEVDSDDRHGASQRHASTVPRRPLPSLPAQHDESQLTEDTYRPRHARKEQLLSTFRQEQALPTSPVPSSSFDTIILPPVHPRPSPARRYNIEEEGAPVRSPPLHTNVSQRNERPSPVGDYASYSYYKDRADRSSITPFDSISNIDVAESIVSSSISPSEPSSGVRDSASFSSDPHMALQQKALVSRHPSHSSQAKPSGSNFENTKTVPESSNSSKSPDLSITLKVPKGQPSAKKQSRHQRFSVASGSDRIAKVRLINEAAANGQVALLAQYLQESRRDVQTFVALNDEKYSKTPLMRAAAGGHTVCMELLVLNGAEFGAMDKKGRIALHHAIEAGKFESVKWLAERFRIATAPPGYPLPPGPLEIHDKYGFRALHLAAKLGRADLMDVLLANGAVIDSIDNDGRTPLYSAIQSQEYGAFKYLVDQGADLAVVDKDKEAPLIWATKANSQRAVEYLLEKGVYRSAQDVNGDLAIHHAARLGHMTILEMLYLSLDDLEAKNKLGERPLHIAAGAGQTRVVKALIRIGCQVNVFTSPPASKGLKKTLNQLASTPLHYACSGGYFDCGASLIQNGASVNAPQEDGTSALMMACQQKNPRLVALLLEHGADVNAAKSSNSMTALHIAARGGDLDSVKLLVDYGANLTATTKGKTHETPLEYALAAAQMHGKQNPAAEWLAKHQIDSQQKRNKASLYPRSKSPAKKGLNIPQIIGTGLTSSRNRVQMGSGGGLFNVGGGNTKTPRPHKYNT